MKLIFGVVCLAVLAACGSLDTGPGTPGEATTSPAGNVEVQPTSTQTTGTPASTAAIPDPLADLPDAAQSPFARMTHLLDIGAIPIADAGSVAMGDLIDRISFYASSYIPKGSSFMRFETQVGSSYPTGMSVTEVLGVTFRHNEPADVLIEAITSEIAQLSQEPVEWETVSTFVSDLTFGRQISPPPLAVQAKLSQGSIAVALAPPNDNTPGFTLFVNVTERHPEQALVDVEQPPPVADIERTLTAELSDESWSMLEWRYSLFENEESGAIDQALMFNVVFEAPSEQLYESLLAGGSWYQHENFPPDSNGFHLYSNTFWMQAYSGTEQTQAIVNASP